MMFITFTKLGIIICLSVIVATQLAKYLLNKFNINKVWITYLPLIILGISYIVYVIILKTLGVNAIVSAIGLTAISCYGYDVVKSIIQLIKSVFHKES